MKKFLTTLAALTVIATPHLLSFDLITAPACCRSVLHRPLPTTTNCCSSDGLSPFAMVPRTPSVSNPRSGTPGRWQPRL